MEKIFKREQASLWLLFGLVALLSLWLGFATFTPRQAVQVVAYSGYAMMCLATGFFGFYIWKSMAWGALSQRARAGGWKAAGLILIGSIFLHVQEPHGFKIVNDELVQVSTSQRMHHSRDAEILTRGYRLGTDFVPMQGFLDKRPLLFPFLVSVLHDLTGYRPENAFILNALLTPLLLGLLYLLGVTIAGVGGGTAAVLLFSTLPLLIQTAAGGGFEMLNLVMILSTILLGIQYARRPCNDTLGAFCLSGVLLANVRYESVLFVPVVGLVIAYISWKRRQFHFPAGLLVAPLLLVISPLQFAVVKLNPVFLQLGDRASEHGLYSIAYFYQNVGKAISYFIEWDHSQSNSHLVAVAGVIGVGFFLMQLYRAQRSTEPMPTERVIVSIFLLALGAQALLMLCYFWGAYDDVITVRLSLPTQLLFVLAFVFVYPELTRPFAHRWRLLNGIAGVYLCLWTLPTLAQRAYAHTNFAAESSGWYREYLRDRPDRNFFVIDPRMPVFWLAYEVPSINLETLTQRMAQFCASYERHSLGECLIVQKLVVADFSTGALSPISEHDFGAALKLEPLREIRYTPNYVLRMSRIVGIDQSALMKWATSAPRIPAAKPATQDFEEKAREAKFIQESLKNLP